jgi:hypothetical protein
MKDFHDVMKTLKEYIAQGKEDVKVKDKEVAFLLGISQAQLATIKRRNSMPYSEILEFCKRENICSNEIFFD